MTNNKIISLILNLYLLDLVNEKDKYSVVIRPWQQAPAKVDQRLMTTLATTSSSSSSSSLIKSPYVQSQRTSPQTPQTGNNQLVEQEEKFNDISFQEDDEQYQDLQDSVIEQEVETQQEVQEMAEPILTEYEKLDMTPLEIIFNEEYNHSTIRINHEEVDFFPTKGEKLRKYLSTLSDKFSKLLLSHSNLDENAKRKVKSKDFYEDFIMYLSKLTLKFSKKHNMDVALISCKDNTKLNADNLAKCQSILEKCNGSLEQVMKERLEKRLSTDCFNETKMRKYYSEDPEFEKLLDIAINGIDFEIDNDFVINNQPEKIRPLQEKLQVVYNYHVDQLLQKENLFVFHKNSICQEEREKLNFISFHWALKPKTDKIEVELNTSSARGRLCFDLSNREDGLLALNGGKTKELNVLKYGKLTMPTEISIFYGWVKYRNDKKVPWNELTIGKEDVDAAFNQTNFAIKKLRYMIAPINEDYWCSQTAGNFGNSALPAAYGNISRCTKRNIVKNPEYDATLDVICDDYVFLGPINKYLKNKSIIYDVVENQTITKGALGSNGKSKNGQKDIDVYGFLPNLETGMIRPMDKALQKLQHVLFSFDMSEYQSKKVWQAISSLTERYSHAIRTSRSFVRPFEQQQSVGYGNGTSIATPQTKEAIEIWRMLLLILYIDKDAFSVPIEDFVKSHGSKNYKDSISWEYSQGDQDKSIILFGIKSDAGQDKVASVLYFIEPLFRTETVISYTVIDLPETCQHVNFQPMREYIGLLMGLVLLKYHITLFKINKRVHVRWFGDNQATLDWSNKEKSNSLYAQKVHLAIVWFKIVSKIHLEYALYMSGEQMIVEGIDALSRGKPHNFDVKLQVHLQDIVNSTGLTRVFTPTQDDDVRTTTSILCFIDKVVNSTITKLCEKINKSSEASIYASFLHKYT